MTSLTVIVPATDRPPDLDRALAAIHAATEPPDEVIVVDGPAGAGPAEARNDGALRALGDVLVFVDSDVLVHRDAFVQIRRAFDADTDLAAIFGNYDLDSGHAGRVSSFRNLLFHHVHAGSRGPTEIFWAGLGAIRREEFVAIGGFHERFRRASVEDIDLGARLFDSGAAIRLDEGILGTHLKRWTLAGMVRTDLLDRGVPWVGLMIRRREVPTVHNLAWRHRLSAAASVAFAGALALRRPRHAAFAGFVLIGLNRRFYALLARRRGRRFAVTGVALHVVHHLTAAAAVPVGVAAHLRDRRS